jgi:uncharacterized protein YuzE
MHLTYDPQVNMAYIRFRAKRVKVTTIAVSEELNVDIGPDRRVYGIELLNANKQLGSARVKTLIVQNPQSGKKSRMALAS